MSNGMESLIHRDYAAFVAAVPLIAVGALTGFSLRDRGGLFGGGPQRAARSAASGAALASPLPQDVEYALIGVLLAVMADQLEHDPAAFPALAGAASRLVPPTQRAGAGPLAWTGLTERARRAAVQVLRPAALNSLVRALTYDYLGALG
jgi:hypothetical protein